MFENAEPLSAERHAGLRLSRRRDYSFARDQRGVLIALSEAIQAGSELPLVFSGEETPSLLAVTGVGDTGNLFVDAQGAWRGCYVPAMLRCYPLATASSEQEGQMAVIIDPEASELQDTEGEPLYDEQGQRSPPLEERIQLLQALQRQREQDKAVTRLIVDAGILTPQEVRVGEGTSQRTLVRGFQVVDRDKLNALDDATLADWARRGLLRVIEAHLASLEHMQALVRRATAAGG